MTDASTTSPSQPPPSLQHSPAQPSPAHSLSQPPNPPDICSPPTSSFLLMSPPLSSPSIRQNPTPPYPVQPLCHHYPTWRPKKNPINYSKPESESHPKIPAKLLPHTMPTLKTHEKTPWLHYKQTYTNNPKSHSYNVVSTITYKNKKLETKNIDDPDNYFSIELSPYKCFEFFYLNPTLFFVHPNT